MLRRVELHGAHPSKRYMVSVASLQALSSYTLGRHGSDDLIHKDNERAVVAFGCPL